jgi:23S rRNA (guanosine2251-2'-O)-methyltransferase
VSEVIYGKNPIEELLFLDAAPRKLEEVFFADGINRHSVEKLILGLEAKSVPFSFVTKDRIKKLAKTEKNQGIAAIASDYKYARLGQILDPLLREESALVLALDGITDPRNLGGIIRSAAAFRAAGIVIPERNSAGVSPVVSRAAAGFENKIKIARSKNFVRSLADIKREGFWIYGLDASGVDFRKTEFSEKTCLVIGNEGKGMSRLTRENCDFLIRIPIAPEVDSLNASVAAGIALERVGRVS